MLGLVLSFRLSGILNIENTAMQYSVLSAELQCWLVNLLDLHIYINLYIYFYNASHSVSIDTMLVNSNNRVFCVCSDSVVNQLHHRLVNL